MDKYRVYSKYGLMAEEWIENGRWIFKEFAFISQGKLKPMPDPEIVRPGVYETLMKYELRRVRYTGFLDINGADPSRELYQDDLLIDQMGIVYRIFWRDKAGMWSVTDDSEGMIGELWKMLKEMDVKWCGDIHKNHEMWEGQK